MCTEVYIVQVTTGGGRAYGVVRLSDLVGSASCVQGLLSFPRLRMSRFAASGLVTCL